jgi:hypothetical protein
MHDGVPSVAVGRCPWSPDELPKHILFLSETPYVGHQQEHVLHNGRSTSSTMAAALGFVYARINYDTLMK